MDKKNDPRKSCLLKLGEDESNVSIREKKKRIFLYALAKESLYI